MKKVQRRQGCIKFEPLCEWVTGCYQNVVLKKEYSWKFYSEGKLVAEWTKERFWLDQPVQTLEEKEAAAMAAIRRARGES
jgi:hypothetical protein